MITFACPQCAKALRAQSSAAGTHAKCPGCSQKIVIPIPEAELILVEGEAQTAAVGWKSKVLALCKKYGASTKFAVTTILGIVPGGPALTPLIEKVFDTAQKSAQDDWESNLAKQVQLTGDNVARIDQILDILGRDLQHLMAQMASLQHMPGMAAQLLIIARDTDDRCKAAINKLDQLSHQAARIESGIVGISAAQQDAGAKINEILLLVRQISAPAVGDQRVTSTVTAISHKVETVSSKAAYLDESVRCGKLVLTNTNLDLLEKATEEQLDYIRELYAPRCSHLKRQHLAKIWKMKSLELLDLSGCTMLDGQEFWQVLRGGESVDIAPPLQHLYLRNCPRIKCDGAGSNDLSFILESVGSVVSLYIDNNRHFNDPASLMAALRHLSGLNVLSISGCGEFVSGVVPRKVFGKEYPHVRIC